MNRGGDERQRLIIRRKDEKITALEEKCRRLTSSYQTLEQRMQAQSIVSRENAWAECAHRAELEDALAQLRAAEAYIEQQDRARELEHEPRASQHRAVEDLVTQDVDEDRDGEDEEWDVSFFRGLRQDQSPLSAVLVTPRSNSNAILPFSSLFPLTPPRRSPSSAQVPTSFTLIDSFAILHHPFGHTTVSRGNYWFRLKYSRTRGFFIGGVGFIRDFLGGGLEYTKYCTWGVYGKGVLVFFFSCFRH